MFGRKCSIHMYQLEQFILVIGREKSIQPYWGIDGKHVLHFPTIGGHNIQPYWKIDGKHVLHFPTIGGHNIQPFWGIDGKHVLHFPTIL